MEIQIKIFPQKKPITEMSHQSKTGPVMTRKRVGETLCYFYKIKQKVDICIFRPFNVFGPGMPRNDYRVFPRFLAL